MTRLRQGAAEARARGDEDPWEPTLRKIKGLIAADGIERVSTTDLFDLLEVPMGRRPTLTVRLSRVMKKLGWSNIRARGLNPGSYRDLVSDRRPSPCRRRCVRSRRGGVALGRVQSGSLSEATIKPRHHGTITPPTHVTPTGKPRARLHLLGSDGLLISWCDGLGRQVPRAWA
jgi:hypothetical protein